MIYFRAGNLEKDITPINSHVDVRLVTGERITALNGDFRGRRGARVVVEDREDGTFVLQIVEPPFLQIKLDPEIVEAAREVLDAPAWKAVDDREVQIHVPTWEAARKVARACLPQPTDEGMKRYEPTGFYESEPCTCFPGCPSDCKGGCGCNACSRAYGDFLSSE